MSHAPPPPPAWTTGSALRDRLAALAEAGPALVAQTMAWSAINSGSRELEGLARMAAPLQDALAALPGEVRAVPLADTPRILADGRVATMAHGAALELRVRPEAPVQLALTGHYDTVFPASHPFQMPHLSDNGALLHGPGVADMKGGLVVMLAALAAFEAAHPAPDVGYTVLISPDEEIGSPASAPLLAALGARAHFGLTYEPSLPDGSIVSARKGSGNFHLAIRGRSAHVGRAFADGRSAIAAAAAATLQLEALNGRREGVTVNVGAIDGGGAVNVVPDAAVVRFNIRAPDLAGQTWIEAAIADVVAAVAGRDGVSATLHGGITRPPKPLTPTQAAAVAYVQSCGAALGLSIGAGPSGGVCEGNNLFAAGCPNIDTLGPRGGGLHSEAEFAHVDSFAERAQLSFLLLSGIAAGALDVRGLKDAAA